MTHHQDHNHSHCNKEHEHSDNHHHHDNDNRPHDHYSEGEMPLSAKFSLLLNNWIAHNNSHKESYLSWADKAESDKSCAHNLSEAAKFLRQTAELSEKITENLENALKSIHH